MKYCVYQIQSSIVHTNHLVKNVCYRYFCVVTLLFLLCYIVLLKYFIFFYSEDCQYTLYDIKYRMAIGNPLTTEELQRADRKLWCLSDDKFIPFHTPKQRCLDNLNSFCKMTEKCKYEKLTEEGKSKHSSKQTCWKDFVLGAFYFQ
jgi:hypothetical protein